MSKFLKKSLPLIFMDLAPNTAVIRSGSFHAHGNKQKLKKENSANISQMIQYFMVYVSVTLYVSKN